MKKIILLAAALATSAVVFTSCEKEDNYTCVCTLNGQKLAQETFANVTKSDAEKQCNDYAAQFSNSSGGAATCSLD